MQAERPFSTILTRLRAAGLRPTRQRMALARLLFTDAARHVSAESLHGEALDRGIQVSLATVYNTLNQFTDAGILREVVVGSQRTYFDTNTSDHHHFFDEESGALTDIAGDAIALSGLPAAPDGRGIGRIDVVVRLRPRTEDKS